MQKFMIEAEELAKNDPKMAEKLGEVKLYQKAASDILGNQNPISKFFFWKESLEALKILGKENPFQALEFKRSFQVEALKILGKDNIDLALDITDDRKLSALKSLGVKFGFLNEDLSFNNSDNLTVSTDLLFNSNTDLSNDAGFRILDFLEDYNVPSLPIIIRGSAEIAKKFEWPGQVEALKELGVKYINTALGIESEYQVQALKILNPEYIHLALKFHSKYQVEALKIFQIKKEDLSVSENINKALGFSNMNQIEALKKVGADKADCILDLKPDFSVEYYVNSCGNLMNSQDASLPGSLNSDLEF